MILRRLLFFQCLRVGGHAFGKWEPDMCHTQAIRLCRRCGYKQRILNPLVQNHALRRLIIEQVAAEIYRMNPPRRLVRDKDGNPVRPPGWDNYIELQRAGCCSFAMEEWLTEPDPDAPDWGALSDGTHNEYIDMAHWATDGGLSEFFSLGDGPSRYDKVLERSLWKRVR